MSSPRELSELFLAERALYVAEATVAGDRWYLERFFDFLDGVGVDHVGLVDFECFQGYRAHLEEQPGRWGRGFGDAFLQRSMQVPRLFLNWAFSNGYTLVDFGLFPLPHRVLPEIEVPTVDQVRRLLAEPDPSTPSGFRDLLVMEFYYTLALRRRESHRLDLGDLSLSRQTVRVVGKRKRERVLPLSDRLCAQIDRYLRESRPQLRPHPGEPAFWISPQSGRRLGYTYLREIVRRYSERLGLEIYPHLLRHASATHLLEGGAELPQIQAYLGHSNPNSTQRYAKVQPLELKAEFERCHPRARS